MKNRKLLLIVSLVLALTMSLGGTLAYLQDYDADVNTMVLGNVTITQNEQERNDAGELVPFTQDKPALPAVYSNGTVENEAWDDEFVEFNGIGYKVFDESMKNVIDKMITVTNTGNSAAYVRTIVAIEAPNYDRDDLIHYNWNSTDCTQSGPVMVEIKGVQYVVFAFTYKDAVAAKNTTAPSLVQLFLDPRTTNEDVAAYGPTWEVLALSQAIQADGFADPETALNEGFGVVNEANVASWFGDWETWEENGEIGTPGIKWPTNNPPEFDGEAVENKEDLRAQLKAQLDAGETEIVLNANGAEIDAYYCLNKALVPAGTTLTIKGANFTGSGYGNAVAGTVIFENCKFSNPAGAYSIHFDAGNGEVIFNDCILEGWCSFGTAIKSVVMNNCQLKGNGIYAMYRFYQPTTLNNCVIDCSDAPANDGWAHGLSAVSGAEVTVNNCTLKYLDFEAENAKIIIDGDVVVESTGEYVFIPNSER